MPKINVYLPDALAAAVRSAGVPVSPVCQQALAEAVRTIGMARKAIEVIRNPQADPDQLARIGARVATRATGRLLDTMRRAREYAAPSDWVETRHLLIGLLDEGANLGLRLLQSFDVDAEELRGAAAGSDDGEQPTPPGTPESEGAGLGEEPPAGSELRWDRLSLAARESVASALEAAIELGHNYLGCEHLLLGLVEGASSGAGGVLRAAGVDSSSVRRGVSAAITGFVHGREATANAASSREELLRRLEALEERLTSAGI